MSSCIRAHAITLVRREIAHGAVAPIVHQFAAFMFLGDICVVEAEARQKLDSRNTKTFQIRNFFDQSQISAWMFNATGRTLGETPDMHFINDRIGHRAFQGLVPFPVVVVGVNDNAAHAAVQVVAGCAGSSAIPEGKTISF